MPGYTHMQKAMPSSVGIWAGSFGEALYDDAQVIGSAINLIDQSPLGSAAGYGVPLKLDRKLTAKLLGFKKVQSNVMYCQNSRGKFEAVVIASLVNTLSDINRFASDLMLFTTAEFNFFTVDSELCSGSSIMPQKKNLDLAELLRSAVKKVLANYLHVAMLPFDLPSGYNRDLQNCKKPLIESIKDTKQALSMTSLLLSGIKPNKKVMDSACTLELFATHKAFELVEKGMSFRDAYRSVSKSLEAKID
jgi:argininosuccinate lyase